MGDHLPIFTIMQNDLLIKRNNAEIKYKRIINKNNINQLNIDFSNLAY